MTRLVAQEDVILFECCVLYNMIFLPQMVVLWTIFKKILYFNVKCHFV